MRHWTSEERIRQSLAIYKWRPWKSSTGAKTKEGKAISKMNAYKHGGRNANAREVLRLIARYRRLIEKINT